MRCPLFGLLPTICALLGCGGNVVVDEPLEAGSSAPTCAADSPACQLPGLTPPTEACGACVSGSICGCHDLNAQGWTLPASCAGGTETCSSSASMTSDPACQVAAVAMAWCLVGTSHGDCTTAYFAAHPGGNEPLGMEFAVYECAVCASCKDACAGTPNVADLCGE